MPWHKRALESFNKINVSEERKMVKTEKRHLTGLKREREREKEGNSGSSSMQ